MTVQVTEVRDVTRTPVRELLDSLESVIDEAYPTSEYYHANSAYRVELNELARRVTALEKFVSDYGTDGPGLVVRMLVQIIRDANVPRTTDACAVAEEMATRMMTAFRDMRGIRR